MKLRSGARGKAALKIPAFLQFILFYTLTACLLILTLYLLINQAGDYAKDTYLGDIEHSLHKSAETLESTIREIYHIPAKMDDLSYFRKLRRYAGDRLDLEHYHCLYMSKKHFAKQVATLESAKEIFLYFTNNTAVIGRHRAFDSIDEYLSFDLVYSDHTAAELKAWLSLTDESYKVLPLSEARVHSGASERHLLVAMRRPASSVVVGAVFAETALQRIFDLPQLPPDTFLLMTGPDGAVQYRWQYEGTPPSADERTVSVDGSIFYLADAPMAFPATRVTLGIPGSYLEAQYAPFHRVLSRYLWFSILIGGLCSGLFAIINYLPIKKLNRSLAGAGPRPTMIQEYDRVVSHIERSADTINQLQGKVRDVEQTLRENLFMRLLYGTTASAELEQLAARLMPQVDAPYRVVLFQAGFPGGEPVGHPLGDRLRAALPAGCMLAQVETDTYAAMPAEEADVLEMVTRACDEVGRALAADGAWIRAGISDALCGYGGLNAGYDQAWLSLRDAAIGMAAPFQTGGTRLAHLLDFAGLQRLREQLLAPREDAVALFCRELERKLAAQGDDGARGETRIQAFYFLRMALESAAAEAGMSALYLADLTYSETETIHEMIARVERTALALCGEIRQAREMQDDLSARVISYINRSFTMPEMCADIIAQEFHVSRSSVFRVVREVTGRSLNEYIEQLRMDYAVKLLGQTDIPISEISQACGYLNANTFYKVFRKHFSVAPSAFR